MKLTMGDSAADDRAAGNKHSRAPQRKRKG